MLIKVFLKYHSYFQYIPNVYIYNGKKDFNSFKDCCNFFLKNKITRHDCILSVGGGSVSDLTGFVASSLLRGIKWKVVPTTLLSMVDASIGGKTGIDTEYGKNLIGSFYKPEKVYLDTLFLKGLSEKEYRSGLGEIYKYCFLSRKIFNTFKKEKVSENLISQCIEFKERIIEEDPFDVLDIRIILNMGHSIAHVLETLSDYSHGECVHLGLIFMSKVFGSKEGKVNFKSIVGNNNNNFKNFEIKKEDFIDILYSDKKRNGDSIKEILPININEYVIKEISIKYLTEEFFKFWHEKN